MRNVSLFFLYHYFDTQTGIVTFDGIPSNTVEITKNFMIVMAPLRMDLVQDKIVDVKMSSKVRGRIVETTSSFRYKYIVPI